METEFPKQLIEIMLSVDDSKNAKIYVGLESYRKWRREWCTTGLFPLVLTTNLKSVLSDYESRRKNN